MLCCWEGKEKKEGGRYLDNVSEEQVNILPLESMTRNRKNKKRRKEKGGEKTGHNGLFFSFFNKHRKEKRKK